MATKSQIALSSLRASRNGALFGEAEIEDTESASAKRVKRRVPPRKARIRPAFLHEGDSDSESANDSAPRSAARTAVNGQDLRAAALAKADEDAATKTAKAPGLDTSGDDACDALPAAETDMAQDATPSDDDATASGAPDREEDGDAPAASSAAGTRETSATEEGDEEAAPETPENPTDSAATPTGEQPLTDPELIALLEQLSATIDTANQVLSEVPPPIAAVDEFAVAGIPERPAFAPRTQVIERPGWRARSALPRILVAASLIAAGGGAYLWAKSRPGLLAGVTSFDFATLAATKPATDESPLRDATAKPALDGLALVPPMPLPKPPIPSRKEQQQPKSPPTVREAALTPETAKPEQPTVEKRTPVPGATPPDQPAHGPAGQPIALGLELPAEHDGLEVTIMVRGVPDGATLTTGTHIGGGTWIVEEKEVAKLALVTPADFAPQDFSLDIALVKSDGKLPATRSIGVVVEPAHAPVTPATHSFAAVDAGKAPPVAAPAKPAAPGPAPGGPLQQSDIKQLAAKPQPAPERPSALGEEEETRFLMRGEELLELGDLASARLAFEYAARHGSKRAMLMLAKTYDPQHLAKLGIPSVQADPSQAKAWYERASRKADR